MRPNVRRVLIAVAVVAVVVAGVVVVKKRKMAIQGAALPAVPPVSVSTARMKTGELVVTRSYLGTVEPLVGSQLALRVTGHILEVRVREGDEVTRGQVLAVVDSGPFAAQYNSLKAQLEGARSTLSTLEGIYRRDLMLYKNKAISKERLDKSRSAKDEATAKVITLEESLKAARLNLDYCTLRAPMDGVITRRLLNPVDLAQPGKPVLSMEAPKEGYKVVVKVPQELVGSFGVGTEARIYPSSGDRSRVVNATVSRVYPGMTAGALARVEADLEESPFGLPSGSTVEVALVLKRVKGLLVPLRSLLRTTGRSVTFAVDARGRVRVVPVEVLGRGERVAAVFGALKEGEQVVVGSDSLLLRLHNGSLVNPRATAP